MGLMTEPCHPGEILKFVRGIQHGQLSACNLHDTCGEAFTGFVRQYVLDQLTLGALNHSVNVSRRDTCVKP